jgi:hypothetical protein
MQGAPQDWRATTLDGPSAERARDGLAFGQAYTDVRQVPNPRNKSAVLTLQRLRNAPTLWVRRRWDFIGSPLVNQAKANLSSP